MCNCIHVVVSRKSEEHHGRVEIIFTTRDKYFVFIHHHWSCVSVFLGFFKWLDLRERKSVKESGKIDVLSLTNICDLLWKVISTRPDRRLKWNATIFWNTGSCVRSFLSNTNFLQALSFIECFCCLFCCCCCSLSSLFYVNVLTTLGHWRSSYTLLLI